MINEEGRFKGAFCKTTTKNEEVQKYVSDVTGSVNIKKKENISSKCVQGVNANKSGFRQEKEIEKIIVNLGVYPMKYSEFNKSEHTFRELYDEVNLAGFAGILFKHVPYRKLWGTTGYSEFMLHTKRLGGARIDSRFQDVPGSVEEKVYYLFETASRSYQEKICIIVLDGRAVKPEIRNWLVDKARAVKHKEIKILTLEEFRVWAKSNI
jgi:hypothetical protein